MGNPAKYSASIVPYSQVDLAFKSSGYVERVLQVKSVDGGMRNVDDGDWVKTRNRSCSGATTGLSRQTATG